MEHYFLRARIKDKRNYRAHGVKSIIKLTHVAAASLVCGENKSCGNNMTNHTHQLTSESKSIKEMAKKSSSAQSDVIHSSEKNDDNEFSGGD